jgi:7 transmembrane sweet-taste receptor of 3 GCPR
MSQFVPESYPRILQDEKARTGALFYTSILLSVLAFAVTLSTFALTVRFRKHKVMRYAQIEFLWILLAGLALLSIGSVISSLPPTDGTCVAISWLINLGYTLELVPLIVKVAALNRLMSAARQMRRLFLKRRSLFGAVAVIAALVIPRKGTEYVLTDSISAQGERIVSINHYCASDSKVWRYVAVAWNCVLLVVATVLAFQTRKLEQAFNESQILAIMIYSHFIFVVLRVSTFFLEGVLNESKLAMIQSLIYGIDVIATVIIYFGPKLVAANKAEETPRYGLWSSLARAITGSANAISGDQGGCSSTSQFMISSDTRNLQQNVSRTPDSTDLSAIDEIVPTHVDDNIKLQFSLPEIAGRKATCTLCGVHSYEYGLVMTTGYDETLPLPAVEGSLENSTQIESDQSEHLAALKDDVEALDAMPR